MTNEERALSIRAKAAALNSELRNAQSMGLEVKIGIVRDSHGCYIVDIYSVKEVKML